MQSTQSFITGPIIGVIIIVVSIIVVFIIVVITIFIAITIINTSDSILYHRSHNHQNPVSLVIVFIRIIIMTVVI